MVFLEQLSINYKLGWSVVKQITFFCIKRPNLFVSMAEVSRCTHLNSYLKNLERKKNPPCEFSVNSTLILFSLFLSYCFFCFSLYTSFSFCNPVLLAKFKVNLFVYLSSLFNRSSVPPALRLNTLAKNSIKPKS